MESKGTKNEKTRTTSCSRTLPPLSEMICYKLTSEPDNWTVQPQRTSFIDIFSFLFSSPLQSIDSKFPLYFPLVLSMSFYQGSIHIKNQLMICYKLTSDPDNWTEQPQRTSFIDICSALTANFSEFSCICLKINFSESNFYFTVFYY